MPSRRRKKLARAKLAEAIRQMWGSYDEMKWRTLARLRAVKPIPVSVVRSCGDSCGCGMIAGCGRRQDA